MLRLVFSFIALLVVAGTHLRLKLREQMPPMDTGAVKICFEVARFLRQSEAKSNIADHFRSHRQRSVFSHGYRRSR